MIELTLEVGPGATVDGRRTFTEFDLEHHDEGALARMLENAITAMGLAKMVVIAEMLSIESKRGGNAHVCVGPKDSSDEMSINWHRLDKERDEEESA